MVLFTPDSKEGYCKFEAYVVSVCGVTVTATSPKWQNKFLFQNLVIPY